MTDPSLRTSQATSTTINTEDDTKAMLNILEDFRAEKGRLEEVQRAVLNILEDFAEEKTRLEETQRAMLNLLEDFDVERSKTEAANRELLERTAQLEAANKRILSLQFPRRIGRDAPRLYPVDTGVAGDYRQIGRERDCQR